MIFEAVGRVLARAVKALTDKFPEVAKAFVPVIENLIASYMPRSEAITASKVKEATDQIKAVEAGMFSAGHSGLTPDEAKKHFDEKEARINTAYMVIAGGGLAVGHISPSGGEVFDELFRMPYLAATFDAWYNARRLIYETDFLKPLSYKLNEIYLPSILSPSELAGLKARALIAMDEYLKQMRYHGYDEAKAKQIEELAYRYPTKEEATEMLWREKITELEFRDVLRKHGVKERYIEPYFDLTKMIPPASDLITMCVREVFDPERRKALLIIPTPKEFKIYMKKKGFDEFWSDSYWAMHWVLPPVEHLNEMFHRGVIDFETWKRYMILHDYMPEAVPWYEKIIYVPFTRVDVRRMYEEGVLTYDDVVKAYKDLGYDDEKAKKLAMWIQIREAVKVNRERFKKGWINVEAFKAELRKIGVPEERITELVEITLKADKPERLAPERDLTKSEIIKGVRKKIITLAQGKELLMRIGYDEFESEYLLAVHLGVGAGSPESYLEFRKWVELYRKGIGIEYKEITPELLEQEKLVESLRKKIEEMRKAKIREEEVALIEAELGIQEARYREMLKKLLG